jgi:hypothetical protein
MTAKARRNWWEIKLPNSDEGGSSRRNRVKAECAGLASQLKPTHLAPGEENCRCQNHFGMDDRADEICVLRSPSP